MPSSKASLLGHGLVALLSVALLASVVEFTMRMLPALRGAELAVDDRAFAWAADRLPSQHPQLALVVFTEETDDGSPAAGGGRITNRAELARLIAAVDAAGARAIGVDFMFLRPTNPADDEALVNALRASRAPVVLGAADERMSLRPAEGEFQSQLLARSGRPAGYINLRVERDGVIRYTAAPAPASRWADSFASVLVRESKLAAAHTGGFERIAWLSGAADGTDTFLTLPANIVLAADVNPAGKAALATLKDKVVLIGRFAAFQDRHKTPISSGAFDQLPGVAVHTHIAAQLLDGRSLIELGPNGRLAVIALSALFGYWVGFRFRISHASCFLKTAALVGLIGLHILVFSYLRVFIPATAMLFGFIGALFLGDYVGLAMDRRWLTWLGLHPDAGRRGAA